MYVCVCMYMYSHTCTCSCDTYILKIGGTCIMNPYTPNTGAKLCIKHIEKWWRRLKAMKSTLDANIIIISVQSPMHSQHTSLHLQIDQTHTVPQGVGDASIQQIIIQISQEKKTNKEFSVSSRCHDAIKKQIVSTSPQGQGLQQMCMRSVWYKNVWSLAFITIVYFAQSHTNCVFRLTWMTHSRVQTTSEFDRLDYCSSCLCTTTKNER